MVEAAGESDIDRGGGNFLNPASDDSLVIERGALSAGLAPSEAWGFRAGAGEEGGLGRKREGRSAFIMTAYSDIERVTELRGVTGK